MEDRTLREQTWLERLEGTLREARTYTDDARKMTDELYSRLFGPPPPTGGNAERAPAPMGAIPVLAQSADELVSQLVELTSRLRGLQDTVGVSASPQPEPTGGQCEPTSLRFRELERGRGAAPGGGLR